MRRAYGRWYRACDRFHRDDMPHLTIHAHIGWRKVRQVVAEFDFPEPRMMSEHGAHAQVAFDVTDAFEEMLAMDDEDALYDRLVAGSYEMWVGTELRES